MYNLFFNWFSELLYLKSYKAFFFKIKICVNSPTSYIPYVGLKFMIVGRNKLPANSF